MMMMMMMMMVLMTDDDDECRVPFASYEFLAMTAQTITDTITEMAEAECEASDR